MRLKIFSLADRHDLEGDFNDWAIREIPNIKHTEFEMGRRSGKFILLVFYEKDPR